LNLEANAKSLPPEVGAPRLRPELTDEQLFQQREQESALVEGSAAVEGLPPSIVRKLSRQPSSKSTQPSSKSIQKASPSRQPSREERGDKAVESASGSAWPFGVSGSWFGGKQPRVNTMCSTDSQLEYATASQTIIIFDWDDTLCPSTCMRPQAQFDRLGNLRCKLGAETTNELKLLSERVVPLLRAAQQLGKVVMVTNAKSPWVDISCQSFLPALQGLLKDIPIIYALELIKAQGCETFEGSLLQESKARAMREAVSSFYSRYPGQSWKNIVSIGDAYFEHQAIRQVVGEKKQEKPCRTKTIKLLESPTIAGMVVQLSILLSWLPQIIKADADVDIDLSADEETVNGWVQQFGEVR